MIDPEHLADGLLTTDGDGVVVVCNEAAARLIGRGQAELIGLSYRDALPLSDPAGRDWWACTRPFEGLPSRRRQPERRLVLATPDGPRDVLMTAAYVRKDRGTPVVSLVVSLRDAWAREREDRSSAELISTVAHELRSPLTSVKGFTATLLAKWGRFTDEQKQLMLQTVNADADRLTRLIAELLDVSRIDAGRLELRRQVVDVTAAVHRTVAGHEAGGVPSSRFRVQADADLPEIWADPDKLAQVLGNLVENALRHGSGAIRIAVRRAVVAGGPGVSVTVDDEGEGIPEELAGRIFTKFWRGTTRGSTGLGLYIAKGLIESHGGAIAVTRNDSGGARFEFWLPEGRPFAI